MKQNPDSWRGPIKGRILKRLDSSTSACTQKIDIESGIIIYGAGDLGLLALNYCEACQIPILAVLDQVKSGCIKSQSGRLYKVSSPTLRRELADFTVVIAVATRPFSPIKRSLINQGWKTVVPFYDITHSPRDGHPLHNGWKIGNVSAAEICQVNQICDKLADEQSLLHYEAFIAWHSNSQELVLQRFPIDPACRYLIPEMKSFLYLRRKCLVDVGSHSGQAAIALKDAGFRFEHYFFFEPDKSNFTDLEDTQAKLVDAGSTAKTHSQPLGAVSETVSFGQGLGYCSQIWDKGKSYRKTATLDSYSIRPDLVKIHTEGTELSVLHGATNIINESTPALAYSVYHRRTGFYEDIIKPMELFEGYNWFFRLHNYQGTGAFIYAVPVHSGKSNLE